MSKTKKMAIEARAKQVARLEIIKRVAAERGVPLTVKTGLAKSIWEKMETERRVAWAEAEKRFNVKPLVEKVMSPEENQKVLEHNHKVDMWYESHDVEYDPN